MFFTFFCVFSIAFILQIMGSPITISPDGTPQENQEGTHVPTPKMDCFYAVSFDPRVTSGEGRERRSAKSWVTNLKTPVSFGISGIPGIDALSDIETNEILAQNLTFDELENISDKDLLEHGWNDITIRADSGGPPILKKVTNGRNKTTGGVTINGGRGSTAVSGNAKIKLPNGGAARSGNATTRRNGTATSGKVTINGGSGGTAVSGDATTGDGGNSTTGSASNGGSDGSAISGDATTGEGGNASSGNAITNGSDGSAISGDATVNGTSSADGGPDNSAAATSAQIASGTASQSTSITSSKRSTKTPVIIGSTIGSLVLVGTLVLLAILWRRRKNRSKGEDISEDEGLRTTSRPESNRASTISSSSSTYPSPFEPIRRGGDFPLPSGNSLPQPRMLPSPRGSNWPPTVGNQNLENVRRPTVQVAEITYGASPPPSYLSPQ